MNLETRNDGAGLRQYLDGRAVHCGAQLQLQISPDVWHYARYEATFYTNQINPVLYTTFGKVFPDEGTVLRWPPRGDT